MDENEIKRNLDMILDNDVLLTKPEEEEKIL